MQDELVGLEVALLAKEKGFTCKIQNCAWKYLDENCQAMRYDEKTCVLIPTQSLLQKWLREKHKTNAIPEPLLDGEEIVYQYKVYSFSIKKRKDFGDFYYKTYEDCLEAALLQALNLIK